MAKKIKTVAGTDGYEYPITSYELVVDENGESIKDKLAQLSGGSGGSAGTGGQGMTEEQAQQLNTAYTHSQSAHVQQSDIPTKTSDLTNDSDYVNSTYVNNKIAEASLSGGEVDLSGYVTKEIGNASQITFSDGQTFQAKLDAGTLKGEKGDKGDTGAQGPQGIQGEQGPAGTDGVDGQTPNITIGTVTTLEAGTNATAEITGITPNLTLDLGIPKGSDGSGSSVIKTGILAASRRWNVLGDSITAGYKSTTTYHEILKTKYSIPAVRNYGVTSSQISTGGNNSLGSSNSFCNRYADMNDNADLITVLGGVNDFLHDAPMGTFEDTNDATFYGALKKLCEGLITKYPNSTIIFMTILKSTFQDKQINSLNLKLEDYNTAIKEVCNYYCIPVIDTGNTCRLQPNISTIKNTYMPDGLHPNADGHKLLANAIEFCTGSSIIGGETGDVPVTGVTLSNTIKSITVNDYFTLTASISPNNATNKSVTWSSNAPDIADVDTNGKVTAKSVGEAIITVTSADGGYTAQCTVTVKATVAFTPSYIPDETVLYYDYRQNSGNGLTDYSNNGNDMTLTKYDWNNDYVSATGKLSSVVNFSNIQEGTIELYAQFTNLLKGEAVNYLYSSFLCRVGTHDDGRIMLRNLKYNPTTNTAATWELNKSLTVTPGQYHHIVISASATQNKCDFYIDNVSQGPVGNIHALVNWLTNLEIDSTLYLKHIRLIKGYINSDAVATLYNNRDV